MPINSDISNSNVVPGVFGQIDLRSGSGSLGGFAKSLLIIGYKKSGSLAPFNVPVPVSGDADINAQVGADSDLAEDARAAFDVPNVRGIVSVSLLPVAEPTGGVATVLSLAVVSAPSGTAPGSNTAATSSGPWNVFVDGRPHTVAILSGDALADVATNLVASINADTRTRWTAATTGGGAFTLTCKHKGKTGNDGVVRIDYGEVDLGLRLSVGTVTFATTATATGTNALKVGATTISSTIANPSTVTQSASAVVADVNAGGYAVTAASSAGVVTLYLAQLRDYRLASNTLTGAAPQTATAVFGTTGTGDPDLTAALAVMAGQPSYLFWSTRLIHTSPLGAITQHITTYNNGKYQKSQILCVCSPDAGTVWGAVLAGTSPAMTAAPQYWSIAWDQPDAPTPAGMYAARLGAYMASLDYVAANLDRAVLRSLGNAPLLIPAVGSRPDPDTRNQDMLSLGISPIVVFGDNQNHVDSAKTTIPRNTAADVRVCELITIRAALYQRYYVNAAIDSLLFSDEGGKNFRGDGLIHTPYVVTADSVKQCILNALRDLDRRDLIQYTEENKGLIQFFPEPGNPNLINYSIPFSPVVGLHVVAYRQAMV